jgi:hypothetical protein
LLHLFEFALLRGSCGSVLFVCGASFLNDLFSQQHTRFEILSSGGARLEYLV